MAIVARTRFLVGSIWCDVRTYRIQRRDGETVAQFSIGSIDGLDEATADRVIDCIRRVREVAERRASAGRSNTGRFPMGENFQPIADLSA